MINVFKLKKSLDQETVDSIVNAWALDENKVFHLKSNISSDQVRSFYESVGKKIGKLHHLAEDVRHGDRDNQRTNEIWMEVRFDSKFPDAYRHSSNPQPFHTDGSYIRNYPNSTLMCCVANSEVGGETIFLKAKEIVKILETKDKKLLEFLLTNEILHERSGDSTNRKIIEMNNGHYKINFNYHCVSKKNSQISLDYVDQFFKFINTSKDVKEKTQAVKLNVGDAVFWKDSDVLHGRNGFVATKDSERFIWKCAIEILEK